jgi:D-alanyl-D-alanine dipeptidase
MKTILRVLPFGIVAALGLACGGSETTHAELPAAEAAALVPLADVDPRLHFDVRYATSRNFTGQRLYDSEIVLLRLGPAERLKRAHDRLVAQGYRLVVFDGYRPLSVQERMWELRPDERYVANPQKGSRHNRGAAVDVALADANGRLLEMPSDYDDFTERAHRDFGGASEAARRHRSILEAAMVAEGFLPLATEWWHFDDPDWERYAIVGR